LTDPVASRHTPAVATSPSRRDRARTIALVVIVVVVIAGLVLSSFQSV
jgi:hypothetical protein